MSSLVHVSDGFKVTVLWGEVHHCVADPVRRQNGRIVHFANPLPDAGNMVTAAGRERHNAILEDEDVDDGGRRRVGTLVVGALREESLEGDQVVVLEDVDFLARFPHGNVLGR